MEYRTWDQDSVFPSFDDPFFAAHLARYAFTAKRLEGRKSVLDLGCGKGYGSMLLAEHAYSVTAVDLNPASIEFARKNYRRDNLRFQLQNAVQDVASSLDAPTGKFDAVISFEVLEHLPPSETYRFLSGLSRHLKRDGLLFISTPNHDVVLKSGMPVPDFHINNLSSREFRKALHGHFQQVEMYGQIEDHGWARTALYGLDIINLRHSELVRRLRRGREEPSMKTSALNMTPWSPQGGAGHGQRFHFSKWLWRQAGMSFAICSSPRQ